MQFNSNIILNKINLLSSNVNVRYPFEPYIIKRNIILSNT